MIENLPAIQYHTMLCECSTKEIAGYLVREPGVVILDESWNEHLGVQTALLRYQGLHSFLWNILDEQGTELVEQADVRLQNRGGNYVTSC